MPPKDTVDIATRRRIAANMRYLKAVNDFPSDAAMGRALGVDRGVVNRALKGERTVGLDVLLRVHRKLHVPMDWLVDRDPEDKRFLDPEYRPPRRKGLSEHG